MDSIFNIFGSHDHSVKLQKPTSASTTAFLDAGPVKPRAKSDSSNVYGKKVLGDVRNTIQQSVNKKDDAKENVSSSITANHNATVSKCIRTPLQTRLLKAPNTVHKHQNLKTPEQTKSTNKSRSLEDELPTPEEQGEDPVIEDMYEDIWPINERPTLQDLQKMLNFWDDCRKKSVFECPPSPDWVPETMDEENIDACLVPMLPIEDLCVEFNMDNFLIPIDFSFD